VSFATITLYVASQRLFIGVSVFFVIDSVRKLSVTPTYDRNSAKSVCMSVSPKKTLISIRGNLALLQHLQE